MKCLTAGRYTMEATLLIQGHTDVVDDTEDSFTTIQWRNGVPYVLEIRQNPDSGAIERHWVVATNIETGVGPDDDNNPESGAVVFPCSVRGFTDGGLRVVGTTERYSSRGYIQTIDTVTMKFPANMILSDRDRVTNIRDRGSKKVLWVEENGKPTVFEVTGVSPIFGPFGEVIEHSTLLNRAQVQEA